MRISIKVFSVVAVLAGGTLTLTGAAVTALVSYQDVVQLHDASQKRAYYAESARSNVYTAGYYTERLIATKSPTELVEYSDLIDQELKTLEINISAISKSLPATEETPFTALSITVADFSKFSRMLVELRQEGRVEIARKSTDNLIAKGKMSRLLETLRGFTSRAAVQVQDLERTMRDFYQGQILWLFWIVGIGFVVTLAIAAGIGVRLIVRPITAVTAALNDIAAGRTDVKFPKKRSRSEIGDLWRAGRAFARVIHKLRRETDILQNAKSDLQRLALCDMLTGLGNRARMQQELDQRMVDPEGGTFGLLLMDLDRFKVINDTLGHRAGDDLLKKVANRLAATVGASGEAMRLGGDEFAVIVPVAGHMELAEIAERLSHAICQKADFEGHELIPQVSMGGAIYPLDAPSSESLLTCADVSMYLAKTGHRKIVLFEAGMRAEIDRSQHLLSELRPAIAQNQLVVHYHPKVSAATYSHLGFEALVRWQHPTRGLLYPGEFLALSERAGLMVDITSNVLKMVAADIRRWKDAGIAFGRVAVNIPEEILATDFVLDIISEPFRLQGVEMSDLTLEITEDVFLSRDMARTRKALQALSDLGAHISLDDFGTGYASLTHLRHFPIDELKIDKSFTDDLGKDTRCEQIVRSLIDLARRLGKDIVAEGVETEEQAAFLRADGCTTIQGYLVSKPLPFAVASQWLAAHPGPVPENAAIVESFEEAAKRRQGRAGVQG